MENKKIMYSAVPSAFIGFYWCLCIASLLSSIDILSDLFFEPTPEITVDDMRLYREHFIKKPDFSDKDVAILMNDQNFVERWNHQSLQGRQAILFFFAVAGLSILIITTISGHEILR